MGGGASRRVNSHDGALTSDDKLHQTNNPMSKSTENNNSSSNEDTLKVEWITAKAAWALGEQFLSGINPSLVKESLKGVASLGKTVPLVGPVVGAILQFWQCYETMGEAAANFQQLQKQVDLASEWLLLASPLLTTSRGMSGVLVREIEGLCAAVQHSTQLVQAMSRRMIKHDQTSVISSSTSTLYNFVLSSEDKASIEECRDELHKSLESFKSSFPAEERLHNMADTCSKLYKLLDEPVLFDATIQLKLRECMAGSRDWLHEEVASWLELHDDKKSKIFWFQASAGMGKTVFAASLVDRLKHYVRSHSSSNSDGKHDDSPGENRLLGAVFFNFTDINASNPTMMVKSLIYQVARALPEIQASMLAAAEQVASSAERENVTSLFSLLLCAPLQEYANNHKASGVMKPMVLVLDALDEAGVANSQERQQLLSFLSRKAVRELPSWVKIFITGRPEQDIVQALGPYSHSIEETGRMKQHQQDLFQYISYHVQPYMVNEEECQKVSQALLDKSESKFVYIAMISEEVESFFLDKDMQSLTSEEVIQVLESLPQGLHECYTRYMKKVMLARKHAVKDVLSDACAYDSVLYAFLSVEVSVYEVVSVADMQWLLDISDHDMKLLTQSVQAVFPVQNGKFVPFHKSIIDWLVDSDHSHNYCVSKHAGHALIATRCLEATLGVDMSSLRAKNSYSISESNWANLDAALAERLLAAPVSQQDGNHQFLSYLTRFLLDHLDNCEKRLRYDLIAYFLLTDLRWMLIVLHCTNLRTLIESYRARSMHSQWCADREVFRKDVKLLLRCFKRMDGSQYNYNAGPLSELCTQLEGRLRPMEGKSARIDLLVVDALDYLKVHKGWRVMTNSLTQPAGKLEFAAEVSYIHSMCSLPSSRVALGFDDSIEIRDYATAQVEYTLKTTCMPNQLCFVPPHYLAYNNNASINIEVMNCMTGEIEMSLIGPGMHVQYLSAFSSSSLLAAGAADGTICIWSLGKNGMLENSFKLPGEKLTSMCASDQYQTVLAAYSYKGLYCWDLSGNCQKVVSEVCDKVFCNLDYVVTIHCINMNHFSIRVSRQSSWESVFYLSDMSIIDSKTATACITTNDCLAMSSAYNIAVYNLLTGDLLTELAGHLDYVVHLLALDDGRLASTSFDFLFRVWNTKEKDSVNTIERGKSVYAVAMVTSDLFALVFCTPKIELWSSSQGQLVDVLEVDGYAYNVITLSDELLLAMISDSFFQIWNFRSKTPYEKQCIVVSDEGKRQEGEIKVRLVKRIRDSNLLVFIPRYVFDIFVFNFHTMMWEEPLVGHQKEVRCVTVMNANTLASCSDDHTLIIWDLSTKIPSARIATPDASPTQLLFFGEKNLLCMVLADSDIALYDTTCFKEVFRSEPSNPPRSISAVLVNGQYLCCENSEIHEYYALDLDSFEWCEVPYTHMLPPVCELSTWNGYGATCLDSSISKLVRCNKDSSMYIFFTYNGVIHCVKRESM